MLETQLIRASEPQSRYLMVVLHGLGDSMEGYRWLPSELDLPWMNYLLVNAPDPYYSGYSWFDIGENLADPAGISRSRGLLIELLDAQRTAGFATEQTFMFGFSQGCLMTWELGMRYPHLFAGLIGISGWVQDGDRMLQEATPFAAQQQFFITHGTLDPLLPFPAVQKRVKQYQKAGINIEWHEFAKAHTIAGAEELDIIRNFVTRRKTTAG